MLKGAKMKFRKMMVLGAAMVVTAICTGMCADAAAPSQVTGGVGGYMITGTSTISVNGASCATTSNDRGPSLYVSGTYSYVDPQTLKVHTTSNWNGSYDYAASISFACPSTCTSVKVEAHHQAKYGEGVWTDNTSAVYAHP